MGSPMAGPVLQRGEFISGLTSWVGWEKGLPDSVQLLRCWPHDGRIWEGSSEGLLKWGGGG